MTPLYFPSSGRSLFGVYHEPKAETSRRHGVVLLYPVGHEYVQAHRAYRQLGVFLARQGFPTVRFDYTGTGDSEGESQEASLGIWREDLGSAIDMVREKSGCTSVCLAGYRMGATLAALWGVDFPAVDTIALWDPIVRGQGHIDELLQTHRRKATQLAMGHVDPQGNDAREILGYLYAPETLSDLTAVDLLALNDVPAQQMLVVGTDDSPDYPDIVSHLRALGADCQFDRVDGPEVWKEDLNRIMVPAQIIARISDWVARITS